MSKLQQRRAELLQNRIRECTRCDLHLYCTAPVPPAIPTTTVTPELLIVGEAPGGLEDKEGEPFVGPAGKLLFRWLKIELGIGRPQVIVTNAAQCRPTVANKGKMNRAPSRKEQGRCLDNVARVVDYYAAAGGRWILLLGATALRSFVEEAKIGAWSGRPFVLKHRVGLLNVMATNHPAAAFRDPQHETVIRRHLRELARFKRGEWVEKCCLCGTNVEVYDAMGIAWCGEHRGYRKGVRWAPVVEKEQGRLAV